MATHAPITGAPTRAPLYAVPVSGSSERHLHLTATPPRVASRRDLLAFAGAAGAFGAAVIAGGAALASDAAASTSASPFARGIARYEAAEAHYESLTGLTKAEWDVAEEVYHREFYAMHDLRPNDWREFMMLFLVAARIGQLGENDEMTLAMIADAKRLTGAA